MSTRPLECGTCGRDHPSAVSCEDAAKPEASLVGKKVWTCREDTPQGYDVSVHATEKGAYEAVLASIEAVVTGEEAAEDEDLKKAIEAQDGKAALAAYDEIISNQGGEAVCEHYFNVVEQMVEE